MKGSYLLQWILTLQWPCPGFVQACRTDSSGSVVTDRLTFYSKIKATVWLMNKNNTVVIENVY